MGQQQRKRGGTAAAAAAAVVLVVCWLAGGAAAQVVPVGAPPSNVPQNCSSQTQCWLMALGPPRTQGEWVAAYLSALHEHCAGLLQQRGAAECRSSARCMFVLPDGSIDGNVGADGNIIRGSSSRGAAGSSLATTDSSDSTDIKDTALLLHGNSSSSGSSNSTPDGSSNASSINAVVFRFWRSAASALQLKQLQQRACLPVTTQLHRLRFRSCSTAAQQLAPETALPGSAMWRFQQLCDANPAACFVRNASLAADMSRWWLGNALQAALEPNSSWRSRRDSLQAIAQACSESWAVAARTTDRRVVDTCATRGIGRQPWNNSISLNLLLVATTDAYESSRCNNSVSASEAMAVEKIVQELCNGTAVAGHCGSSSGVTSSAARQGVLATAVLVSALAVIVVLA